MEILTLAEVLAELKCSRSTVYQLMKNADFPRPLKVGRDNRWPAAEVAAWLARQAAARVA